MIRRDYILRMIEEFVGAMARLAGLKTAGRWSEVKGTLEEQFRNLIDASSAEAVALSETELSARLIRGEASISVPEKTLFLIRLLKEAGEEATVQERPDEARAFYLKGLNLLLGTIGRGEVDQLPEFIPSVEAFTAALGDKPMPVETLALLMRHYERLGEFGKAEDALFALLDAIPTSIELIKFGQGFYERLQSKSDASLQNGNLPRDEVEAGLVELESRRVTA